MKKVLEVFWEWVFSKTTIDEKVIATVKETKKRVKDVSEAVKEVGNQIGDIGDAVKGKARKGRKKKDVK